MLAEYFADSYAFFARAAGSARYAEIFRSSDVVTSALNVLEVYSVMLSRVAAAEARRHAEACLQFVVPIPDQNSLVAAEFQRQMRSQGRHCSIVDAWGYAAARALARKFLTGDGHFKGVDGVAFVQ